MENEAQNYKLKVWQFLDNMQPGDKHQIENICKPENRKRFIDCVKAYMDVTYPYQGHINFNHDYSKIYKTAPIEIKSKTNGNQKSK